MIKKGQTVTWIGKDGIHPRVVGISGTVKRLNAAAGNAIVEFDTIGAGIKNSKGNEIRTLTCWCHLSGLVEKAQRQAEWE